MPSLKKEIMEALEASDFRRIARLASDNKRVFGILASLAYDKDDVICWRAIEAMGYAAKASNPDKPELLRNTVQRLIWSAREESGGMGWSTPELLAEIVRARPRSFPDIPPIIVSLHGEDEENVFRKGVLWALGRMAEAGIDDIPGAKKVLLESLGSGEPAVKGLAAWAAGRMKLVECKEMLRELVDDAGRFKIYDGGELKEVAVGEMAIEALTLIKT